MMKQDVIAVVLGGPSSEAEISRVTGAAIATALREKGYNAKEVELVPDRLLTTLHAMNAKVVFNAVHGKYGEDGRLQSILEAAGIPYTGSGVMASAVAMDKSATKRFLQSAGISTPRCLIINKREASDLAVLKAHILEAFGLPVVIKAATQGSSIGVVIPKEAEEIEPALKEAFSYSENVLVEECIQGKELTVALMQDKDEVKPLPIIWIAPHSGAYDFHSKYTKGATDYHCPAPLDEAVTKHVQELAVAAYRVLGLSGVARVDVMLDEHGQGYVLEANTVPGMTATSLVPKAAAAVGISFPELCERILLSAK
ncbi:MAG: D-alanine--D-alanine ligase [Phascolarctobacterium sp.]|nr:D-alanine--D-alanine ligase [Phascolarctobacterium sp.]